MILHAREKDMWSLICGHASWLDRLVQVDVTTVAIAQLVGKISRTRQGIFFR